jgi:hypothetical protein
MKDRQRRNDELGNLVAALLYPDWRPPLTLSNEPESHTGRANDKPAKDEKNA